MVTQRPLIRPYRYMGCWKRWDATKRQRHDDGTTTARERRNVEDFRTIKFCPAGDPHIWGYAFQIKSNKEKQNDESILTTRLTRPQWRHGRLGLQPPQGKDRAGDESHQEWRAIPGTD